MVSSPFKRRRPDGGRILPLPEDVPQDGTDDGRDPWQAIAEGTGPALGVHGGFANSGVYVDQSVHQQAPRQPAPWPHLVGDPPGRALGFQERAQAARLREVLQAEGTAVVGQVLSGLGGVGKSQLAADCALTEYAAGRLDVLVWITAFSRQAVLDGYSRAAVELLAVEPDQHAAARFLAWLQPTSSRPECRWLIVLDDLADPADLTGLWPAASPTGRTVITTRSRDAALTGPGRRRVDVGVFAPTEATAALRKALVERGHPAQSEAQIEALAEELGFLPLAISQAAAYITNAGLNVADYRALLADRARTLADLLPRPGAPGETGDALPDGQNATVAVTWSLSLERADQLHPQGLARPMLQLTAMLDPHGIPQAVLTNAPALRHLADHRTRPATLDRPALQAEDARAALRALYRLSLIEHTPDQPTRAVRVHELVQRVTRETLTPSDRDQLAHSAADALHNAWPDIERDTALAEAVRANVTALTRTAEEALYRPAPHAALVRMGLSLGQSGQAAAARDHFQHLATETEDRLGRHHIATLNAREQLAYWRGEAGDPAAAAAEFAELLGEFEQTLDPDAHYTLTIRGNLAALQSKMGRPAEAAATFAGLLDSFEKVLGPEHRHTLVTRGQLARSWGEAGDAAKAAAALAELEADSRRILGRDDPDTLTVRSNLAEWRGKAGDAAGAATALIGLLGDRVRVLGPDHPDVMSTRYRLAFWLAAAGDAAGSASTFADLLMEGLRIQGPDLDTLDRHGDIASWLGEEGYEAAAATAFAEQLEYTLRELGPDHLHTIAARANFARWRGQAGDAAGAVAAYAEAVEQLVRVLGPDHPHTLATRGNLARWRGEAGDAAGAAAS